MRLVVNRWGNSAGIRLPKQVLQKLKIDINDEMDLLAVGNCHDRYQDQKGHDCDILE